MVLIGTALISRVPLNGKYVTLDETSKMKSRNLEKLCIYLVRHLTWKLLKILFNLPAFVFWFCFDIHIWSKSQSFQADEFKILTKYVAFKKESIIDVWWENIIEVSEKRVFIVFESESNSEVPLWFQVKPELSMGFPYGSTFISYSIKINEIDQFSLSLSFPTP